MKTLKELDKMTLWDITMNEGAGTQLFVSWVCFCLFWAYIAVAVEVKMKSIYRRQ